MAIERQQFENSFKFNGFGGQRMSFFLLGRSFLDLFTIGLMQIYDRHFSHKVIALKSMDLKINTYSLDHKVSYALEAK